jgi:hypothetical protein
MFSTALSDNDLSRLNTRLCDIECKRRWFIDTAARSGSTFDTTAIDSEINGIKALFDRG